MIRDVLTLAAAILLLALPSAVSAGASLDRGIELFEAGEFPEARQSFEGVLDDDGENHAAMFYLARIELMDENHDGAIDQLRNAVKLDQTNSNYQTWLGRAYIEKLQNASHFEQGVLAGRALDSLKKAVKLDPSNIEARMYLGEYYLNAPSIGGGSKKKAREQALEVRKHDPLQGDWMLARIYIMNEEYDAALAKLKTCVGADPANIEYQYQLGMLYQQLKRYEETFEVLEGICVIDPDARGALYQIGRTAVFSGTNVDRGIECLEIYLTKDVESGYPGHDGAHWRLGMLYEHKGDVATARAEYETAMQINPEQDNYRDSLEKLDKD